MIEFSKLSDREEQINVRVVGLLRYQNWRSCYEDFFDEDLSRRYLTIEEAVEDTYNNWYPKELEEMYGCLVIKFRNIS